MSTSRIATALAALGLVAAAHAATALDDEQVSARVLEAARQYASAISCVAEAPTAERMAALVPYRGPQSQGEARYVVFWSGDVGCLGGSGTRGHWLATVTVGTDDHFVVDPRQSSPVVQLGEVHRGFERLVSHSANTLVIDARAYAATDPNCCPSQRWRYTLRRDAKGQWRQTARRALP